MGNNRKMLYASEDDYLGWLESQITLINEGKLQELDINEIKELLEESARAEIHAVESQLIRLQLHLLKWKYQPTKQTRSWKSSVVDSIIQIERRFEKNQTLKNKITPDVILREYERAVRKASAETGLDKKVFPKVPEWDIGAFLSIEFCEMWLKQHDSGKVK